MTNETVLEALKNVTYPGFSKDIVTFGFVKDIKIDGTTVSLSVDITSSADEVKLQLIKDIEVELTKAGFGDITANIIQPKAPKQMSNSMSGKNIAPQV